MNRELLVVDDDSDDLQLALLAFKEQELEFDVTLARDGLEALELLLAARDAGKPLPAAILTDLKMPRMDGFELIRRIKGEEALRAVPILVFTSSGYEADIALARQLGVARYLRKPASIDDYAGIVRQIRDITGVKAP